MSPAGQPTMKAPLIRATLPLVVMFAVAAVVAAEEPPSSAWTPPGVRAAEPEATPSVGELPTPADETSDDSSEFGGPWLLGDDALGYDGAEADESAWFVPTYWFGGTPWNTSLELGLNGSTGNNESFSIRAGGAMKRKSRFSKFEYSLYYNRTTTDQETTQNNATTDIRNDWMLDDSSPWSLYTKANVFYDQFQAFGLQTNGSSGVGYEVFQDPAINLTTRCGAGASREFGGPDNQWVPEALFGFEYDQKATDTQKFFATFEYYPQLENFGEYRLVASGGWEIDLVNPSNMSLIISANDRFDSTPNDAEPHLVNYSVLLLIKL